MNITFSNFSIFSLLAFLPVIILMVRSRGKEKDVFKFVIAGLMCVCLFLALSNIIHFESSKGKFYLFLLDYSGSALVYENRIAERFNEELWRIQKKDSGTGRGIVVLFGKNAKVFNDPSQLRDLSFSPLQVTSYPDKTGTHIQKAVDRGLMLATEGYAPEIIIIGDGTGKGAFTAVPSNVPYTYLNIKGKKIDAAVTGAELPEAVSVDEVFRISVSVFSTHIMPAVVRVYEAGTGMILDAITSQLHRGENRFEFEMSFPASGIRGLMIKVESDGDSCSNNDVLKRSIKVMPERTASLLVAGDMPQGLDRAYLHITAHELQENNTIINNFNTVLLNNVHYEELGQETVSVLETFVKEKGGGLMVTGRDAIFGPGGYEDTVLDSILPLTSKPRMPGRSRKRIMIAVDKSGSMDDDLEGSFGKKIDAAKAAALNFILEKEKEERTQIGLLFFSAEFELVKRPSEPVSQAILKHRIKTLTAYGGTKIIPALEKSISVLTQERRNAEDEDFYLFIITDGITKEKISDETMERIAENIKESSITLFTLKIGSRKAGVLQRLCVRANGTYHEMAKGEDITVRFMREADERIADYFFNEECAAELTSGCMIAGIPYSTEDITCTGYIKTSLNKNAVLVLKNSSNDDPLAAIRFTGLGRTAAVAGIRSDQSAYINSELLRWVSGGSLAALYRAEAESRDEEIIIKLYGEKIIPAGTAVGCTIYPKGRDPEKISLYRESEKVFAGVFPGKVFQERFAYTIAVNGKQVVSRLYFRDYPDEYNPLAQHPVQFKTVPGSFIQKDTTRSYVPFIIAFLVLFTVYESAKALKRD